MIAAQFYLKIFVDMVDIVDTPAFRFDVIAYPAIFVLAREKSGPTRIAHRYPSYWLGDSRLWRIS
ncbi:hypothetical protein SAMN05216299_12230 [Nitrosospira sp. Nsp14]|nr:hypothetical protein SAMN05216299_12230 [Nitrosospira sp. Nsp14]